jgi:hypothetical protein
MGYRVFSLSEDSFQLVDSIEHSHSAYDNYLYVPISIIGQILPIIIKVLKENC